MKKLYIKRNVWSLWLNVFRQVFTGTKSHFYNKNNLFWHRYHQIYFPIIKVSADKYLVFQKYHMTKVSFDRSRIRYIFHLPKISSYKCPLGQKYHHINVQVYIISILRQIFSLDKDLIRMMTPWINKNLVRYYWYYW